MKTVEQVRRQLVEINKWRVSMGDVNETILGISSPRLTFTTGSSGMTIPKEAVEAAAFALDGHSWMTDNEVSVCACGEVLNPSLEYAGDAYRSHLAELALAAALPAIETEIRAQVAADIWEYWDACGDLIDDRDSARQAIDAIAAQIAKGANHD